MNEAEEFVNKLQSIKDIKKRQKYLLQEQENWLSSINTMALLDRIARFQKLNFLKMTEQEISKEFFNVISFNNKFIYSPNLISLQKDSIFYRVKKLEGNLFPNKRFSKEEDLWETDLQYVSYERLNKPKEPLLYVSQNIDCCIKETNIQENDYFSLIKYSSKEEIKLNQICADIDLDRIGITNQLAKTNYKIINNFFFSQFNQFVGKGAEFLYKISNVIAKDYFDLPERNVQDAWCYSSTKDNGMYNICFRPKISHKLLEVKGALICKIDKHNNLQVYAIAEELDNNGNIIFMKYNKNTIKRLFSELQSI